ncbi:MAG: hypothetical protein BGO49_17585 [Planctomycetales bacterium 71-10]|nr:MAG: hypothetical protein BGO49_17585 [Planctomycetales bacterium 71-10]
MAERPLELDDDPGFQRRMWIWQRWAWGGIAGVLAFAAAGGFGDGPLSRAEARDREGRLRVVYERFGRLDAPNDVEVEARPGPDGRLQLRLGAKFLEDFDVELPEPHRPEATVDAGGITLDVRAAPDADAASLALRIRPRSPGRGRIELGTAGGPWLSLVQFVYP